MNRAELRAQLRGTGCVQEVGELVFLCDPRWGAPARAEADRLRQIAAGTDRVDAGWVCIPTGGTSGAVRFARHDERTLLAAIDGFVTRFGGGQLNAVDVLPPFHVSGLMARLRCAATGGTHLAWDWKRLESGECPDLPASGGRWMISLVPTQLQRLLQSSATVGWLRRFDWVFLGGGPVWPALADEAAAHDVRVVLSYGMTETAAMVAAQTPEEFLAGDRSCGRALPHAALSLATDGTITVAAESVFRGYFPELLTARTFTTPDWGELDATGRLTVLGRSDAMIITGGEKVNPLHVEAVLRGTGEFADVAVIGVPDAEWGECVVACYPAGVSRPDLAAVLRCAAEALPGHQRPKRYVALAEWPRNAQGKLNRPRLRQLAIDAG